jgi:hypothetical protein
MNHYEQKQEARRERLEARAAANRTEGNRRIHEATREGAMPPMGEPIKVGHHSEGKHRAAIKRADMNMRKGCEAFDKADHYERAAAGVGTGGISSDDPDAVVKLLGELASLQASQRQMIAINAAWRKAGNPAPDNLVGWQQVADAPDVMMNVNDFAKIREHLARRLIVRPFPSYSLSNNSANIRRVEHRIEQLRAAATRETKEVLHNSGVRVVQNVEDNRIQLFFDGKPADDIRAMLKRNGFRWSPMAGAWQRHLNNAGIYAARYVLDNLPKAEA